MMISDTEFAAWQGKQESTEDSLDWEAARRLAATLGSSLSIEPGSPLPPLWHWVYFLQPAAADRLEIAHDALLGRDWVGDAGLGLPKRPLRFNTAETLERDQTVTSALKRLMC